MFNFSKKASKQNSAREVEEIVALWASIEEENNRDRELVTDDEWRTWVSVNNHVKRQLEQAIDSVKRGKIPPSSVLIIEEIHRKIKAAKHMNFVELVERKQQEVTAADDEETKRRLRDRLDGKA